MLADPMFEAAVRQLIRFAEFAEMRVQAPARVKRRPVPGPEQLEAG